MSINSKQLDKLLKKGGPAADAIRAEVPKSMLFAHRRGSVPTLPYLILYFRAGQVFRLSEKDGEPIFKFHNWLSGIDSKRTQKRLDRVEIRAQEVVAP